MNGKVDVSATVHVWQDSDVLVYTSGAFDKDTTTTYVVKLGSDVRIYVHDEETLRSLYEQIEKVMTSGTRGRESSGD